MVETGSSWYSYVSQLAYLRNYRPVRDLVSKNRVVGIWGLTQRLPTALSKHRQYVRTPVHVPFYIHKHTDMCIHTHTHTKIKMMKGIRQETHNPATYSNVVIRHRMLNLEYVPCFHVTVSIVNLLTASPSWAGHYDGCDAVGSRVPLSS